jgi:hypothetical protein
MHIENVKKNDFLIITCNHRIQSRRKPNVTYSGEPLLVLAVSVPFILVKEPEGIVCTLDCRCLEFTKADKKYVKEFLEGIKDNKEIVKEQIDEEQKHVFYPPCPDCCGPMRKIIIQGNESWRLMCDDCGLERIKDDKESTMG